MQKIGLIIGLLFFTSVLQAQNTNLPPIPDILAESEQLLLVTTQHADTFQGSLQRYQRANKTQPWQPVGQAFPVVIGKQGVALDAALAGVAITGVRKKEGDQRTPIGVFVIGPAFGFSTAATVTQQFDYFPLKESTICVDDTRSKYYNQVLDSTSVAKPDWDSAEKMQTISVYKHGSLIQYNSEKREKGAGSCIFMHIWTDSHSGTDGCIAMEEVDLKQVLSWLDRNHNPTIGIFSATVYKQLKNPWKLP